VKECQAGVSLQLCDYASKQIGETALREATSHAGEYAEHEAVEAQGASALARSAACPKRQTSTHCTQGSCAKAVIPRACRGKRRNTDVIAIVVVRVVVDGFFVAYVVVTRVAVAKVVVGRGSH
jgi:hypothetical protein